MEVIKAPQSSEDEVLIEPDPAPSSMRIPSKRFVIVTALLATFAFSAIWMIGKRQGNASGPQAAGDVVKYHEILEEIPDFEPFEITPCNPLKTALGLPCDNKCGNVDGFMCESKGWVFCQNAVCDDVPVKNGSKWVSNCHCWQQPENGTVKSILPVTKNSGANCVLDMGPGGEDMCTAIADGALWSTFGVDDPQYLPGKPLKAATCTKHTIWAWCWGAPCKKEGDDIICACPIMKSMNDANQMLSLAGDEQCPPNVENPCAKGWTHNSMPAGTSPSEYMPSAAEANCYTEYKAEDVDIFVGVSGQ